MIQKVIYLKDAKEIKDAVWGGATLTFPAIKEIKHALDGSNMCMIIYKNGAKVEIDRSNIAIISKE